MASIIKVDQIQTAAGGTPTAADLGINTTGNVLQVVTASLDSEVTVTATSPTDVGLSASITPSSASSKIMIIATAFLSCINNNTSFQAGWTITDSANNAILSSAGTGSNPYDIGGYVNATFFALHLVQTKHGIHSPATTSAVTYKLRAENDTASSGLRFNPTGATGTTLTLLEIAG